jgi:hypothetical protein
MGELELKRGGYVIRIAPAHVKTLGGVRRSEMSLQNVNASPPNRVREIWRESRRRHDRFSIYQYWTAVFDLVMVWQAEDRAVERAKRALRLKGREGGDNVEPFAAVIRCTSSRKKVDAKARSKWDHALMFAAEYKAPSEPLDHFIRRHRGINACAAELSRLSRTEPPTR